MRGVNWFDVFVHYCSTLNHGKTCFNRVPTNSSTKNVLRPLRASSGRHNRRTELTILNTISNGPHPASTEENKAAVAETVRQDRQE